ncbi:MAG: hypothetical protein JRI57_10820 [Deltaproteobacteria bacterium]|nr:hypothetical protein [Deltaproteobacteria bacterium]MBW2135771.1 hypothetical protein [Deltaproteobacteria bacterium]
MTTMLDELLNKIKVILQGPDGELFYKIVHTFDARLEEEYDTEILNPEDWTAMQAGEEAVARGD